jgi:biotin carboxyl carrier protein
VYIVIKNQQIISYPSHHKKIATMNKYQYKVQGIDYEVEIAEVDGNIAKVNVNGIPFEIELQKPINAAKHPTMNTPKVEAPKPAAPAQPTAVPQPAQQPQAAPAGAGKPIKAPLPGTITDLKVSIGQEINVGDVVLVLEAMKMQNNIESEYDGTVTSVTVKQGETVMEGATLLTIG